MAYEFRKGLNKGYFNGVEADVIGTEIEKIQKAYGTFTAEELLDIASNPLHPLHKCFGRWDDAEDARKHRLQLSRQLSTCFVRVEVKPHPDYKGPQNVCVKVVDKDTGLKSNTYITIQQSVEEYEGEKYEESVEHLIRFCEKYVAYPTIVPFIERIKIIIADMKK